MDRKKYFLFRFLTAPQNKCRIKSVSKVPSTRLKMSEHGDYLAVGASDGTVTLISASTFKTVCHSDIA